MTNFKMSQSKCFLFGLTLLMCVFIIGVPAMAMHGSESTNDGDLKIYEKKSLFIFPIQYNNSIGSALLSDARKEFLAHQMFKMFVIDFRRINFFDVKAGDSIDTFLQDSHSYILKNVKNITEGRMGMDRRFKEAMVTDEELLKTTENSFALVPCIDSLKRELIQGKNSTSYAYAIYIHFDVYNTKTKEKIKTLKINNKKNWIGALSSIAGSLQVDNSDLAGLPEDAKKDEKSYRNAIAGLFTVLKKQLKELPEFRITAELSMINHLKFGFDMGKDTGIKIDHRYSTYVTLADGKKKMTGFGKIRKVNESYSEAQIFPNPVIFFLPSASVTYLKKGTR